jgi:hypothetical protein
MATDTALATETVGAGETGENSGTLPGNGDEDSAEIKTLAELLSTKGRHRLRELARAMKDSGALRIKDHRLLQGNFPNSFKGECALTKLFAVKSTFAPP